MHGPVMSCAASKAELLGQSPVDHANPLVISIKARTTVCPFVKDTAMFSAAAAGCGSDGDGGGPGGLGWGGNKE